MRRIFSVICIAAGLGLSIGCADDRLPFPDLDPDLEAEFREWVSEHAASPEDYVLSKFTDHDIVFLGEYHRIRHDALLIQDLIPLLYPAGIRTLGIEFAAAADQADIDRLLAAEHFDQGLANQVFWNLWPWWGFQEYVDILHAAWQLNRELPPDAPPFRVVGLNARMDWSHVWSPEDRNDPEVMKQVFPDGDSDEVMARTIRREILAKGEKALIYSGINHAYTRFHQPVYDVEKGELVRSVTGRMGNRTYAEIGDRAFVIFLHSPWPSVTGYGDPFVYPAEGVIDALFATLPPDERRVGFDIKDSPFGQLSATDSYWSHAAEDFRLDMYCDGWIYQRPLSQYDGVTVIEGWINEENRLEAIAQIANPDPRVKDRARTVEDLTTMLAEDTDFKRRFARFR